MFKLGGGVSKSNKRNLVCAILSLLFAAVFFCGFFAIKNTQKAEALTTSALASNATKIGNGDTVWNDSDDLWNSTKGRFDGIVYADLKSKLFDNEDPATFIKDSNNYDAKEKNKYTGAYVVQSSKINSKISDASKRDYGYVVKLGGKDWMVTSMTIGKQNQPVVTLMLADPTVKSAFLSDGKTTDTTTLGRNMYSSSKLRKNLLEGGDWSFFASGTFAQKYLVQPTNIPYQHTETMSGRYNGTIPSDNTPWTWTLPNDALDTITTGWPTAYASKKYTANTTYDGTKNNGGGYNARYDAWGTDYIWIPSGTEVGTTSDYSDRNYDAPVDFIWGMSNEQKKWGDGTSTSGESAGCWYRTGFWNGIVNMHISGANGRRGNVEPNTIHYVRPAIHLNLVAIENSMSVNIPQNASTTYDGNSHDLKGESWYNTIFDNTSSSGCSVAYTNDKGANVSPTDAGTYTATFTLGADYFWGSGDKTDKTRTSDLIIEPKKLDVSFVIDSTTELPTLSITNTSQICTKGGVKDEVNPVIRYYDKDKNAADRKDLGTDITKLKGNTQYYANAEFDNKNYVPNTTVELSFINPATPVNVSWVVDGSGNGGLKPYTGQELSFELEFDSKLVEISYDADDDAEFDDYNAFYATNAGKHTVNLKLKDKVNYCWGSDMGDAAGTTGNTTIEFEITPAARKIEVATITPSNWTVTKGGTLNATLDLEQIFAGTMEVMIYAQRGANSKPIELGTVEFTTQTHSVQCELSTAGIRSTGTYTIGAQAVNSDSAAAKNYSFIFDDDYTLTVEEAVQSGGILWRLFEGSSIAGSMTDDSGAKSTTWDKKITYTGNTYNFTVNPSGLGTTVDSYKTVKSGTSKNLTTVKDAGDYVTTVTFTNGDEYSISWTIERAKFDLSKVRWIDDGKLTYVAGGTIVALDPATVPAGLTPTCGRDTNASGAGSSGTAEVTFAVDENVLNPDNYVLPEKGDKNSYIFTANGGYTDFEWEKPWTVSTLKIPVNWTIGTIVVGASETEGGKKINAEVVAGGFDQYIEYLYYETNAQGVKLDPEAAGLKEPEVTENVTRHYIAEVHIKSDYDGNCEFASDKNLISPVFDVGNALTAVTVEAQKEEYVYWGSPVKFLYNVKGAISSNAFDITYFKGNSRLENAPTDPGEYRAQISLKSAYTSRYYLDGKASFTFTIVHASINVSWNDSVTPPVLNLTEDQAKYVTYEYRDGAGNTVSFNTLKTTPGNYDVIAKITDTNRYQFTGDSALNETFTQWYAFEIDDVKDVTDPSNSHPTYKPTDPNGDGSGTTSGKTPIWIRPTYDKVRGLQIDNEFGWDINAFTVTYFLNGRVVPNCNAAGDYYVEISLDSNKFMIDNNSPTFLQFTVESGDAPGGTTTTPDDNGTKDDGTTGDNPSDTTIISYLPIILSGVSLVLIVVFLIMTLNNLSAAKEAREKTKKLAAMSYSVSPMGLLAIVLGLAESNWWIIAGVLMALALVMAIAAFMTKGKKRKALLALEEEQARIAEEKEYARREEMRMMFSSMQQGYQQQQQPQLNYEAIQGMITSSMQAFLPAMQQMMALPPAQSDPNAYQQPAYAAPNPEAEALRAQLAAQQAQMAEQQAQMAKQQEMLAQILQNQQAQQEYEEEPVDDISWLGNSEEVVSLEESYGNLDDDGRRFYYEIGSYIMNKPRTSQNDGRYAVLFKYRGRTIFKLCIKDDAPVLYYPTGSGGRGEVRIADAAALEYAKSVIDRTVATVDGM